MNEKSDFEKSADDANVSFLAELWEFLRHSKKWWMLPILVVFLLFAVLMILGQTAAAPFIYTLF